MQMGHSPEANKCELLRPWQALQCIQLLLHCHAKQMHSIQGMLHDVLKKQTPTFMKGMCARCVCSEKGTNCF